MQLNLLKGHEIINIHKNVLFGGNSKTAYMNVYWFRIVNVILISNIFNSGFALANKGEPCGKNRILTSRNIVLFYGAPTF